MMEIIARWFLYFIIYSVFGYVLEIIFCAIDSNDHKLRGRGFLFGPVCPIYGCGALLILLCHQWLQWPWWATFFMAVIVCDTLEYLTSFLMEKIFHVRWWDYRENMRFSINGRVSLYTSVLFGVGGMFIVYLVQPAVQFLVDLLPAFWMISLAVLAAIIMFVDTLLSVLAALAVKSEALKGVKFNLTPEIKKFARDYYRKHNRVERKTTRKSKRVAKRAAKKQAKRG